MKRIRGNSNFVGNHESSFSRRCARTLATHIKENPSGYPLKIEEIMEMLKLKYDSKVLNDYRFIERFFVNHRKHAMSMFDYLITSGWFNEYKDNGHSEEEIYQAFIDKCINEVPAIIPLYCDVDYKYKLITLDSFMLMLEERLKATGKEMGRKFKYFNTANKVLPNRITAEIEMLKERPDFKMLKEARNELNKYLPEGEEDGTTD